MGWVWDPKNKHALKHTYVTYNRVANTAAATA